MHLRKKLAQKVSVDSGTKGMHFVIVTVAISGTTQYYNGARTSQSEPHTNHSYEKISVPMYVCN